MRLMRKALFLTLLFLISLMAPMAAGATVETQFSDGSTSYSHTFSGTGNGTAGYLTIPWGAEVTDVEFNLRGEASSTSYSNFTTNAHFGGAGDGSWSGSPPSPFTSGQRNNADVSSKTMSMKGNPTLQSIDFGRPAHIQSKVNAHHNTTGQFVSFSDQGYSGLTKKFSQFSVSTSASWSYIGVVAKVGDEFHIMKYSSSSLYNTPTILRINASTGAYIGTASLVTNGCSTSSYYNMVDATVDGTTVYTAHYTSYRMTKWSVITSGTSKSWRCDASYTYSNQYVTGVDIDDATGKLYVATYSYSAAATYLNEVSKSNPSSIQGTWTLATGSTVSRYGAGMVVNMPTIVYNEYDQQYVSGVGYNYDSYHHFFTMNGNFIEHMGEVPVPEGGHYGLVNTDTGQFSFSCHQTSTLYCSTGSRKVNHFGDGSLFDSRTHSTTTASVLGSSFTSTKAIDRITVSSILGYTPTGTSISVDLSNDGGNTWRHVTVGQTVVFAQSSTSFQWRATLNGTVTKAPIFDGVGFEYVASYVTSSYMYAYQYVGSGTKNVVAATATWDEDRPVGTSISVKFGYTSNSQCTTSTGVVTFTQSNQSKSITGTGYYMCMRIELSGPANGASTPSISNLSIARHSNAPSEPGIEIDGNLGWSRAASAGALLGPLTVLDSTSGTNNLLKRFNDAIPDTGGGFSNISVGLVASSSGILVLESFAVTYIMNTVNLEIDIPEGEILHERLEPYEVVTRHVIGEDASTMTEATLTLMTNSISKNPTMYWQNGDIFPTPNDPEDYIELDASSWSTQSNGILEIHWIFYVTSEFPDQSNVRFKTGCVDNSGSAGYTPVDLVSSSGLEVNRSFGLGWLKVRDNDGALVMDDVPDNSWVAAGETLYFQGAMWFLNTEDAPRDNAFDVRISRNGWVESTARDTTNNNGTFFISIDLPEIDVEEGMTYEVQTYNEKNPAFALPPDADWRRTYKIDATAPHREAFLPLEDAYEAASPLQEVKVLVNDDIGHPMSLELMYWVESDHDLNRNGEPDPQEYVSKNVHNSTVAKNKWFITTIDHSRNPNMGRVSYYWTGGDQAGNQLHYTAMNSDEEVLSFTSGPGFSYDDATFRTRKDSTAIFTGLDWEGHVDDAPVYAGMKQTISLGFIDANTAIDFEYISLVFDFEGPNPIRDAQQISYSGMNDTFWSESDYINLLSSSEMVETINESGLPWIQLTFEFVIGWDWPDEEMGDVALRYKERGSTEESQILLLEHTFRVENDLMLSPTEYVVEDISEPRTGVVADGSRVRKDDRLAFTGRVVYEGSTVAAPRDVGILVEVFDGEKMWSDGSISSSGEFSVEVPLSSASTLQSSPTRTCLISITNIPGKGEDMTGTLVSTTLRVIVDDAAPRVVRRITPLNIIDISANNDLTNVPVEFHGTEDADLTGSSQIVHWVMRDATRTVTLGAGSTLLGMQQDGQNVIWTGSVDLTDNGRIIPESGDFVGFYVSGYDTAGNQFPVVSNSEASPIPELAIDDTDFERQWIRLGAVGAELRVSSISLSDDHIAPGASITIDAKVTNVGGSTPALFKVAFFSGDDEKPFDTVGVAGIDGGEIVEVSTVWNAEDVDRIRVVVDYDESDPRGLVVEVNDFDNSAEHSIEIAYSKHFGILDSPRESPLAWIFGFTSILVLVAVATVAARTTIDHGEGAFTDEEDEDWEDDEYEDDDEFDEEEV